MKIKEGFKNIKIREDIYLHIRKMLLFIVKIFDFDFFT